MQMIKMLIKRIFINIKARKNGILITRDCQIDLGLIDRIGYGTKIQNQTIVFGDVEIGNYSSINGPGTQIGSRINGISIGNFCSIASGVVIQEYYHKYNRATSYYINRNIFGKDLSLDIYSKGSIKIEDDVWIGANSVILSGVTIGRGSIIGAGSIVTKNVPRYSIAAGNPAKVIKSRFHPKVISYLESTKWWEWDNKMLNANIDFFNKTDLELFVTL